RIGDELKAILSEGPADHSLLRLRELVADRAIHPHLGADEDAVALLKRLTALNEELRLGIPPWRLGLEALSRKMPAHEIAMWLQTLKVRRTDADLIAAAVTVGPRLAEQFRGEHPSAAEVAERLKRYDPDAPLFALALEELP